MLHSVFGSNRPLVQVFLLIPTAIGVAAAVWITEPGIDPLAGPPVAWLQEALIDVPFVGFLIGGLLYLMSAYLINNIYNMYGFGGRENYFPALVYVFFSLGMLEWTYMHPVLWANFFVLLAFRRLLTMYRVRSALSMVFDAGLFLGLAILCYPPAVMIVPVIWLALIRFRTFDLREWVTPLTAMVFVVVYVFAVYFWSGSYPDPTRFFQFDIFDTSTWAERGGVFYFPYLILTALPTVVGIIIFLLRMRGSTLHMKNTKAVFLRMTLLLVATFVYSAFLAVAAPGSVLILSIPIAVYTGVFFSRRRLQRWMLLIFYLWFIAVVGFVITANGGL